MTGWTMMKLYAVLYEELKFMLRSILEEVYFVIDKYLFLGIDRTLGEYVY